MKSKKNLVYLICIGALFLLIVVLLIVWAVGGSKQTTRAELPDLPESADREVVFFESDKPVPNKYVIDNTVIRDTLEEINFLVTSEYYFTDVTDFSKTRSIFGKEIGLTTTSFIASYDGCVTAGLDLSKTVINIDEDQKKITIALPAAEIKNVEIDFNSFQVYQEKDGIFNHLSVSDVNAAQKELDTTVRKKATSKGILEKASAQAKNIVRDFVQKLPGMSDYTLLIL